MLSSFKSHALCSFVSFMNEIDPTSFIKPNDILFLSMKWSRSCVKWCKMWHFQLKNILFNLKLPIKRIPTGSLNIFSVIKSIQDTKCPRFYIYRLMYNKKVENKKSSTMKSYLLLLSFVLFLQICLKLDFLLQIKIVGSKGDSYTGDIAVDDITLTSGNCSKCY